MEKGEEIVISGIACRLPECDTLEEFDEKLFAGENMVKTQRWPGNPQLVGSLKDVYGFDNQFFGVSAAAANFQALISKQLLEVTFQALLDAGLNEGDLRGTNTAVYVQAAFNDQEGKFSTTVTEYFVLGNSRSLIANRISFWLGAKGPSLACVGSDCFQALSMAVSAMRSGETEAALVLSADIEMLQPFHEQFKDFGLLSADGRTRAYDAKGTGSALSDAAIVFILQKASVAKRHYATIVDIFETAYGQTLTRSLSEYWSDLYQQFYSKSRINPNDIFYLEGCGTALKEDDEEEVKAVYNFFCKDRKDPLYLGSVKSNIGHTGGSAGFAGIIKAVTAFRNGKIPANIDCDTPLNCEAFNDNKLTVVTKHLELPKNGLIAINSRNFGNNYAHVVLKKSDPNENAIEKKAEMPWVLLLSSRLEEDMKTVVKTIEQSPFDAYYYRIINDTLSKKRVNYLSRGYMIRSPEDGTISQESGAWDSQARPLWFVFTGMGCQWKGMGEAFLEIPLTRESLLRSHAILEPRGLNLLDLITQKESDPFENILHSFVGIASIQIALVDLLYAMDIRPDGIIGHSVGELGCAYADGCLTAEQMLLAAYSRGKASLEADLIRGMMAAIGKGYEEFKDMIPEDIDIACHNSKTSCTISGPSDSVHKFVDEVKVKGIFAKAVNVSNIAYHSRYIKPAGEKLICRLKEVIPVPKARSSKWISTSVPEANWASDLAKYCSAEYQTNNLLSSVLFEEGCKHIPDNAICLEVAPHGLLQSILKKSLGKKVITMALTNWSAKNQLHFILQSIGKLHMIGLEPKVNNIYPTIEYPVPLKTNNLSKLITFSHLKHTIRLVGLTDYKIFRTLEIEPRDYLKGWVVDGKPVYPYTKLLAEVYSLFEHIKLQDQKKNIIFEELTFHQYLYIREEKENLVLHLGIGTGRFEILNSEKNIILTGVIRIDDQKNYSRCEESESERVNWSDKDAVAELAQKGYEFYESGFPLTKVQSNDNDWRATIKQTDDWFAIIDSMLQLHILSTVVKPNELLTMKSIRSIRLRMLKDECDKEQKITDITLSFNKLLNILEADRIEIRSFAYDVVPRQVPLDLEYTTFVAYDYPKNKEYIHFLEFVFKIILNELPVDKDGSKHLPVSLIADGESPVELRTSLEKFITKQSHKVKLTTSVIPIDDEYQDVVRSNGLVLTGSHLITRAARLCGKHGFMLAFIKSEEVNALRHFSVITSFDCGNKMQLCLMKRSISIDSALFWDISDFEERLKKLISSSDADNKLIYVVSYEEPAEGIQNYTDRVNKECKIPLRWVFILGERAQFTPIMFRNELTKGLKLNINKNGKWGLLMDVSISIHQLPEPTPLLKSTGDLDVLYTSQMIEDSLLVNFSGIKEDSKVIGIGVVDIDSNEVLPDPQLQWTVPKSWQVEQYTNIPYSLTLAYYGLNIFEEYSKEDNILITNAFCDVGMALISTALYISQPALIYITVKDENQKKQILGTVPTLLRQNISLHSDPNCWNDLQLSGEMGVICNNLDKEYMDDVLRCIKHWGRCLHFDKSDIQKNSQIGMFVFLKAIKFKALTPKTIYMLREDEKKEIHENVENMLQKGMVKQLPQRSNEGWYPLSRTERINFKNMDSDLVYVVIGDEEDVTVHLVQSLLHKGAKKIVVHHSNTSLSARNQNIYQNLTINQKIKIDISHGEPKSDMLKRVSNLGHTGSMFVVALNENSPANDLLRQLTEDTNGQLVVIASNDKLKTLTRRRPNTMHIVWDGWSHDAFHINNFLERMLNISDTIFVRSANIFKNRILPKPETVLNETIPSSLQELEEFSKSLQKTTNIKELMTRSKVLDQCYEVAPLIFVPGLHQNPTKYLEPLAKELLYPALYVHWGLEENTVDHIVQKILELNISNVNLIGISWGNIVAIDITRALEEKGIRVRLFLVGYSHIALKAAVSQINAERYLMNRYFKNKEMIGIDYININSFDVEVQNCGVESKEAVKLGLNFILSSLLSAKSVSLEPMLKSRVHMVCKDAFTDKKISKISNEEYINVDWTNLHESKELIELLHYHALYVFENEVDYDKNDLWDVNKIMQFREPNLYDFDTYLTPVS